MEQVLFPQVTDSLQEMLFGNGRNPLIFKPILLPMVNKMLLPQARIYKAVTTNGLVPANKKAQRKWLELR
jgi:hypothetical protein